jgi:ATP-dependent Clp protease ATP-binding subunit ClpC
MTSNVGARLISRGKSLGFLVQDNMQQEYTNIKDTVTEEVRKAFNPEFINRLDELIVFHPLGKPEMRKILDLMLVRNNEKVEKQGLSLELSDEAKEFLLEKGFDPNYGARPLNRVIQKYLDDMLAEGILSQHLLHKPGEPLLKLLVDINGEKNKLEMKRSEATKVGS